MKKVRSPATSGPLSSLKLGHHILYRISLLSTSLLGEKARGFWHGIEGERKQNSQRETYHCDQLGESSVMA